MSELVVLFEDKAHESLVRQLFGRAYNLRPPKVRYERCGDCTGVERRLSGEVEHLRSKNFQRNRGLVVVIDADHFGVDGRNRRLDDIIKNTGEPRSNDERIAYVIPRLEAENWYIHFCCPTRRPIDEAHDYKHDPDWRRLTGNLGSAACDLAREWQRKAAHEPISVQTARQELARIFGS